MKRMILTLAVLCIVSCKSNPETYIVNNIFADNEITFSGYLGSADNTKEMVTMTLMIDKALIIRGYYTSDYLNDTRKFYGRILQDKRDYKMVLYEIDDNLKLTGWKFGFEDIDSDELKGRQWSPECSTINNDFLKPYIYEITTIGHKENTTSFQVIRDVHLIRKRN